MIVIIIIMKIIEIGLLKNFPIVSEGDRQKLIASQLTPWHLVQTRSCKMKAIDLLCTASISPCSISSRL